MYRVVVKKCNIILDIERNKFIRKVGVNPYAAERSIRVKGTKEGFPCMSCIMLHANMKD